MSFADRINRITPSATLAMTSKAAELKAKGINVLNLSVGEPDFNTPENMYSFTFSNIEVFKNFGFSASLRFQDDFLYESTFANMMIPAYGTFDAQVNYKIESLKVENYFLDKN